MTAIDILRRYRFRDEIGHPLENCIEYQAMTDLVDAALDFNTTWDDVMAIPPQQRTPGDELCLTSARARLDAAARRYAERTAVSEVYGVGIRLLEANDATTHPIEASSPASEEEAL